jgi:site-specific recombinase XerD
MSGPLVAFVDGFEAELGRQGYAPGSVTHHLRLMAGLDGWLTQRGLDATRLTTAAVDDFMASRRAQGRHGHTTCALEPLLAYLRDLGVAPAPRAAAVEEGPVEALLERYRSYLAVERGLAASTVRGYATTVRPFLEARAIGDRLDLDDVTAADVTAFVVASCRVRRGREVVTAMRSLLGFLAVQGIVGGALSAAVPSVAHWRLAGLPATLGPGQAQLLLDSCDRTAVIGRRDRAILVLLVRMGLRSGEVAALVLDDIDWHAGEITVSNGKRGRRERLPLPVDVGQALVDYLRDGRPANAQTRHVFVRALAPPRGLSSGGVAEVVRVAGVRAGIGEIGPHRLRHTAASQMLQAGAPLAEIGEVLRHRLTRTTAIYAKVDHRALRELARPWPGGGS